MTIPYEKAQTIVAAALAHGTENGFKPLTVAVLDPGGALVALGRQDGAAFLRPAVAQAKASGILGLGMTSRQIGARAEADPAFFTALTTVAGGNVFPVQGGVFVHDAGGALLGAVGITGDLSLNDEAAAVAGIEAAGLVARTGAED